jgi:hypothetical protein
MSVNKKTLMAKARGFTISIEKMKGEDKRTQPSAALGRDYNRLLEATRGLYPDLEPLLPPAVAIEPNTFGMNEEISMASHSELDAYCEQIFQLVSECD